MKILWAIYVILGVGAFIISYLLEGYIFSNISDMFLLSYTLALIFEGAKVMTIIMHRNLTETNNKISKLFQNITILFRITLVCVSIGCSVALLSTFLDKPNLNKTILADKQTININYQENKKILEKSFDKEIVNLDKEVKTKYKNRYLKLDEYYIPRIKNEEELRNFEFNNIIGGVRKGERWHEHDRKLNILINDFQNEQKELQITEDQELKQRKDNLNVIFLNKFTERQTKKENRLNNLWNNTDDRSRNQMLISFLIIIEKGLNIKPSYDFMVILFAIITSLLLEGTIYIVFNYLVITHKIIFDLNQEQYIETAKMKATFKGKVKKDNIENEEFKHRVKQQVNNIVDFGKK